MTVSVEYNVIGGFLGLGYIKHTGDYIDGNAAIYNSSQVALEFNIEQLPTTLTFFVNNIEQPNYIINIPKSVRFLVYLSLRGSSFEILNFVHLISPNAKHPESSRSFEWGKKWESDKKENFIDIYDPDDHLNSDSDSDSDTDSSDLDKNLKDQDSDSDQNDLDYVSNDLKPKSEKHSDDSKPKSEKHSDDSKPKSEKHSKDSKPKSEKHSDDSKPKSEKHSDDNEPNSNSKFE
ncbi:MAG: hypothetical protein EZS28_029957 [Streblomastix strix]|uniref:Uncharacterized protein n=1 Tax=Streblomastix strix TaxID=222440 RepID=A0A5J4UW40_9EUKA|nr:MAG: hypothetical protein EZS28_029957 [Streblomastix strix]